MKIFERNILSIYKSKGQVWLESLPQLTRKMAKKYGLSDLMPVRDLSHNYVLSGFQGEHPVILKLGLDEAGLENEATALKAFSKYGAVKLLAQGEGVLLLERAMPGETLKSFFPREDNRAIEIACDVMIRLHRTPVDVSKFSHIRDWLLIMDKTWDVPANYLLKARTLRDRLLLTSPVAVMLHGDLHHDNILKNGEDWIVIDPKGVIGDPAYEVAAFIRNPIPELTASTNVEDIIRNRILKFSQLLNIEPQRILDWCFVQAVLAWVWALEDGSDVEPFKRLTEIFHKTIIF